MDFKIAFHPEDQKNVLNAWDNILSSNRWTEGPYTDQFENEWTKITGLYSSSFSSWSSAAFCLHSYYGLKNETLLCPSNTFYATASSFSSLGSRVEFVDSNKNDLCMSYDHLLAQAKKYQPKAIIIVHIGGHISFEIKRIAQFCRSNNIILIEDCAHAHGAEWHGDKPGSWGDAGIYSFYPTKTLSCGEGAMLVTKSKNIYEYSKSFRNYGKPDYKVTGINARINEFTAALGYYQSKRLHEIVDKKNEYVEKFLTPVFKDFTVKFPEGMKSGYYKYISFLPLNNSTGKVYDTPLHRIMASEDTFPATEWISSNHWCYPTYYNQYGNDPSIHIIENKSDKDLL